MIQENVPASKARKVRIELEVPDGSSVVYEGQARSYVIDSTMRRSYQEMVLTIEWETVTLTPPPSEVLGG